MTDIETISIRDVDYTAGRPSEDEDVEVEEYLVWSKPA